jgi:carbon-monoxide dehydrogenase medium subunit
VVGLRIPRLPAGARSGYVKYCSRSDEDKPLVGVAAVLVPDGSPDRPSEVRIGLGGVAPTALRARGAEAWLRGRIVDAEAIREAADVAASECDPLSDLMGSADYRREMVRVWVRRLLGGLIDGGGAPRPH